MKGTRFKVRKHWRNAVYSNVWIALGAAAATWQTGILIGETTLHLSFFTGFATLFTYNFQRLVKLTDRPEYAASGRNNWLFRNRRLLGILSVLAAIPCLLLIPMLSSSSLLLLSFSGVLSLFYAVRFFPIAGRLRALRDVAYLKLYVIALVWAMVTVALPVLQHEGIVFDDAFLLRFAERFAFIVAITIPFDIRDAGLDDPSQRTAAQLLGERGARYYALVWVALSLSAATALFVHDVYTVFNWIAVMISLIISAVLIGKTRSGNDEMFFTGAVDGLLILQALLVALSVLF